MVGQGVTDGLLQRAKRVVCQFPVVYSTWPASHVVRRLDTGMEFLGYVHAVG